MIINVFDMIGLLADTLTKVIPISDPERAIYKANYMENLYVYTVQKISELLSKFQKYLDLAFAELDDNSL